MTPAADLDLHPPLTTTLRRTEEKERRRSEILEAGARLFAERGLDNLTFGDLAARTRLSRPLIYVYFKDREALFLHAAREAHRRLHHRFTQAAEGQDPGLHRIQRVGRAYVDYHRTEPHWFYLCSCYESRPELPADPDTHALVQDIHAHKDAIMALLVATINDGIRDGSIRPDAGDPMSISLNLWAFSLGMTQIAGVKGPMIEATCGVSPAEVTEMGFLMIHRALASAPFQ